MLSKNLNPLKRFQHLLDTLPENCVFDGEICALDQDGRPDFNALLFARREPVFVVFDLLFYRGEDIRSLPLKERRAILDEVAKRYGTQKSELFSGCGKSLFQTVCSMNLTALLRLCPTIPFKSRPFWFESRGSGTISACGWRLNRRIEI
jgi:bifunctional non-homologous end joining protein LigD